MEDKGRSGPLGITSAGARVFYKIFTAPEYFSTTGSHLRRRLKHTLEWQHTFFFHRRFKAMARHGCSRWSAIRTRRGQPKTKAMFMTAFHEHVHLCARDGTCVEALPRSTGKSS